MITSLAQEIFDYIAIYMDTNDLCALRLTCRCLNDSTFRLWAKSFNTIQTDLGSQSLQRLFDISQYQSLRDHVHGLYIPASKKFGDFGGGLKWSRNKCDILLIDDLNEKFRKFQTCLYNDLVNCRSFHIQGPTDVGRLGELTTTEAVLLLLNIIAETGLKIQAFTVDFSAWVSRFRLKDYSSIRCQPLFNQGWSHLRELHLNQEIRSDNVAWTRDLIEKAPNIRKLSLAFYGTETSATREILGLKMPPLEELYLRGSYSTASSLLNFLHSSRQTLQRLRLQSVYLEHSGIDDHVDLKDWKDVFMVLRTEFPKLRRISLSGLNGFKMRDALMQDWQALLEDNAQLSIDLPHEKFEVVARISRRRVRTDHFEHLMTVFGVTYEGRYMSRALERFEEEAAKHPINLRSPIG